jgi:hypothetical protein
MTASLVELPVRRSIVVNASVDAPNGWTTIMGLYANRVKERAAA